MCLPSDNGRAQGPCRVDAVGADGSCNPHVEGDAQGYCKWPQSPPATASTHRHRIFSHMHCASANKCSVTWHTRRTCMLQPITPPLQIAQVATTTDSALAFAHNTYNNDGPAAATKYNQEDPLHREMGRAGTGVQVYCIVRAREHTSCSSQAP